MLFKHKLKGQAFSLPGGDLERVVRETEGYSGSDLQALCQEAAMMPIRELGSRILTIKANQVVAEHLSGEEVTGINEAFDMMDTEKRSKINLGELRIGLQKLGHHVPEADLQILMEAMIISW